MNKLAQLLTELREGMENESGECIGEIEVSAAVLFSDLAHQLGMTEVERALVLGTQGLDYVESMLDEPVQLNGSLTVVKKH